MLCSATLKSVISADIKWRICQVKGAQDYQPTDFYPALNWKNILECVKVGCFNPPGLLCCHKWNSILYVLTCSPFTWCHTLSLLKISVQLAECSLSPYSKWSSCWSAAERSQVDKEQEWLQSKVRRWQWIAPRTGRCLSGEADGWGRGRRTSRKRDTEQTLIYGRVSQRLKSECTELRMVDLRRHWDWVAEPSRSILTQWWERFPEARQLKWFSQEFAKLIPRLKPGVEKWGWRGGMKQDGEKQCHVCKIAKIKSYQRIWCLLAMNSFISG